MCKKTKDQGQNDCNKKREDFTEADGLRDAPLNPIRSMPTTNCLSAMNYKGVYRKAPATPGLLNIKCKILS